MNKAKMNYFIKNSTRIAVSNNYVTNGHMMLKRDVFREECEYILNKAKLGGKDVETFTDEKMRGVTPWDVKHEVIEYEETPLFCIFNNFTKDKERIYLDKETMFAFDEKYLAILDDINTSLNRQVLKKVLYYLTNEDQSFILVQMSVNMPYVVKASKLN